MRPNRRHSAYEWTLLEMLTPMGNTVNLKAVYKDDYKRPVGKKYL